MFRVTTYVTSSPQTSRRRRSAAAQTRAASSPRASRSRVISSSPSSVPVELERKRVGADDERDVARFSRRPGVVAREARSHRLLVAHEGRRRDRPSGRDRRRTRGRAEGAERARAPACRRLAQSLDLGPRRLRVDMVDRHGRDAAPVVDPGIEQAREVVEREVRRRLHVPGRAEEDRERQRSSRGGRRGKARGAPPSACRTSRGSSGR